MSTVYVVHPSYDVIGGAEVVSLHVIKQLSKIFDTVVIISLSDEMEIQEKITAHFPNTEIKFSCVDAAKYWSFFEKKYSNLNRIAKYTLVVKVAKLVIPPQSKVFSTYGEFPSDRHSVISYIHFPLYGHTNELIRTLGTRSGNRLEILYKKSIIYASRLIIEFHLIKNKSSNFIANSNFTRKNLYSLYPQARIEVVYPPISIKANLTLDEKSNTAPLKFLMIGRVTPQKKVLESIDIFLSVAKRYDVELNIIGDVSTRYGKKLLKKFRRLRSIKFHGRVSHSEKEKIISSCDFGLHGFEYEHYGIAVAEMCAGGLKVFAPKNGGQVEIVKNIDFLYTDKKDAIKKIINAIKKVKLCKNKHVNHYNLAAINTDEDFGHKISRYILKIWDV